MRRDVSTQHVGKEYVYISPYTGVKVTIKPDKVYELADSFGKIYLLMNQTGGATYHRWKHAQPENRIW